MVLAFLYIRDPKPVVSDHKGGIGEFFASVVAGIFEVMKIGHIWVASLVGAMTFGVMLALGVVWMPKILMAHGLSESMANMGASMLWLGLAVGSAAIPYWSDVIHKRKIPIILSNMVQFAAILALLYITELGTYAAWVLCFIFGFFNASHMLSFSTSADVVRPQQIGTSAAIVNGIMFIMGGILMSRPGIRIGWGIESGIETKSLELVQYASVPIIVALAIALLLSIVMKETYPKK